jgi:MCP family monocarboxylic acid transporter-like MFS transporter 10
MLTIVGSAWIGSIQYCLYFMPGLIMGRLVDIGSYRIPFYAAAALYPGGVIATAQCSQYWQTLLSQALLSVSRQKLAS